MNKKLDDDIWILRPRLFPMTLIGKEKTGGQPDAWEFTDYTNRDLDAQVNFAKKYIETQFYSKDEFLYVLEGLEKRAKEYFVTEYAKHISTYAKRDGRYYIDLKGDGEYVINEKLNDEYKSIIVLKKEKLKLLYEKLIRELTEKYDAPPKNQPEKDSISNSEKLTINPETISEYLFNLPDSEQSDLDMVNYIEKVTDGHKAGKLKLLLNDVERTIFQLKEESLPDENELRARIEEWQKKNKEIPYKTMPAFIVKGKKVTEEYKAIDTFKLFPEINIELFPLYQFRNYVISIINNEGNKAKNKAAKKDYTHRQIAIAYCIMGILITSENAAEILKTHSQTQSTVKLLAKRITNPSNLTKLTGNKTTDTKNQNDLNAAKRLISGMKNVKATNDISRIITAFETAYNSKY